MAESFDVQFARDANRIGPDIYKKSIITSVWHRLIDRKPWLNGRSNTQQVLTVQRNLPENVDTWDEVALSDGASNACNPTPDEVPFGYETRQFKRYRKTLKSIPICVDDTRDAFEVSQQAKIMYENLTSSVKYIWGRRYMLEYASISEHKMVAAPDMPESSSHFPNTPPTSVLTQAMLDDIYQRLLADGAGEDGGPLAMSNGAPVFVLITDMKSSRKIKEENKIFDAILWNKDRVPELLQPLKVDREYNGFFHTIEVLPRRFTFANGTYTEVLPFDVGATATGDGKKAPLSQDYLRAPITESYVFLPNVYTCMVPNSIASIGSGTQFDPQSYMGEFVWRNIINHDENPFGTWGKYHAKLEMASMPGHPEFGFAIRHLRCVGDYGLTGCPASDEPTSSQLANLSDSSDVIYGA